MSRTKRFVLVSSLSRFRHYRRSPQQHGAEHAAMEFNWLTFNGKAGPAATPTLVKLGERVGIRVIYIGMDQPSDPLAWDAVHRDGDRVRPDPRVSSLPAEHRHRRLAEAHDIEFVAKYPGDWVLHCHPPHHIMNQMVSMVGSMAHGGPLQTGKGMEEGWGS